MTNSVVYLFQFRRKETWRIIRLWFLPFLAGWIALFVSFGFIKSGPLEELWEIKLLVGCFSAIGISIGRIAIAVQKYYRCPECDCVPTVTGKGVLVDPAFCPNCGVALK